MPVDSYIDSLQVADDLPGRLRVDHGNGGLNELLGPLRSGEEDLGGAASVRGIPDDLQAAVDAGSLLSFVAGVDAAEREDVLYSVQLAQRGASGLFNRFTATEQWYAKYIEILEAVGWTAEQMAFSRFDESSGRIRMDQAALAILSAIATQNQLAILKEALAALEALADDDKRISLFDFSTSQESSGNFQLGAVQKSDQGALSLAVGAFHFQSNDARRRFLFLSWGAEDLRFWTAAQKMTLNTDFYARHRQQVADKLSASASDYIAALDIPV